MISKAILRDIFLSEIVTVCGSPFAETYKQAIKRIATSSITSIIVLFFRLFGICRRQALLHAVIGKGKRITFLKRFKFIFLF